MSNDHGYDYSDCRSNPAVTAMNTEWSDTSDYGYTIHNNPAGIVTIFFVFYRHNERTRTG